MSSPQATNTKPASPNPSPRSRFMSNPEFIKQHRALLENAAFNRAIEFTIAEMTRAICALSNGQELDKPGAQQAQACSFEMINGAHNFIEVMYRLAEPYAQPKAPQPQPENLQHEA